jgi:predicted nucleic acid-binding protein
VIVLDSSALVALVNVRDVHHAQARKLWQSHVVPQSGPVVIPEYVLVEALTVVAARAGMDAAKRVRAAWSHLKDASIVACRRWLPKAVVRFESQERSRLSLVDSVLLEMVLEDPDDRLFTFDTELAALSQGRAIGAQ